MNNKPISPEMHGIMDYYEGTFGCLSGIVAHSPRRQSRDDARTGSY